MIIGYWGLVLNILTISILSISVSILLASLLISRVGGLLPCFEAKSRMRLLWCGVALPWYVSLPSIVLLVIPEYFLKWHETWLTPTLHWHHIYTFPIYSWHGASLILFSIIFALLFVSKLLEAIKIHSNMSQLINYLKPGTLSDGCMIIDSVDVYAFTSGLFRPKAYISSGLRDQLTSDEISVVQQHELAHVKNADPLQKFLFSLLASFFPRRIIGQLNESFSLAIEQLADSTVLKNINDETLISKTILKVVRLTNTGNWTQERQPSNCAFTSHPLELRIRYLLSDDKGRAFPLVLVFALSVAMVAISTFSVELLHHSLEHLFSH